MSSLENMRTAAPSGFTLIELTIYIALAVSVLLVIVELNANLQNQMIRGKTRGTVERDFTLALERIRQELHNATDINSAQTAFDSNPGKLTLLMKDSSISPSILEVEQTQTGNRLVLRQGNGPPDWWNTSWENRRRITFTNTTPSSLHNFPILVSLQNPDSIDYTKTQDLGQDIRFIDSDGTPLSHEIEKWDETGTSFVWVNIPEIAPTGSDFIWMYFNNVAAPDAQNAQGVWSNNFKGVWHLKENPAVVGLNDIIDSSGNEYHGTDIGSMNAQDQVSGMVDGSFDFDGENDYVSLTGPMEVTDKIFTFEAWAYQKANLNLRFFGESLNANDEISTAALETSGEARVVIRDDLGAIRMVTGSTPLLNAWHHITGTADGTTLRLYVDGVEEGTPILIDTLGNVTPDRKTIGAKIFFDSPWNAFNGIIDEVRASSVARSTDWIATTYLSHTNTLHTIGGEESQSYQLTSDNVYVDNLVFRNKSDSEMNSKNIEISLHLQHRNPSNINEFTEAFSATTTLQLMDQQGAVCGNGRVENDEECDDGNTNNSDACTNLCEQNAAPPWWNSGWQKRIKILFDGVSASAPLTNFPALVKLTKTNVDYASFKANGDDVRFIDENNTTVLDYQIEAWRDAEDDSYIWIRVPEIRPTNDDSIWMYYNNPNASSAQDPRSVWDSYFTEVFHLNDVNGNDTAGFPVYGTGHTNTITAGIADGANLFTGIPTDYISYNNIQSISEAITLSAWIKWNGKASYAYHQDVTGSSIFSANQTKLRAYIYPTLPLYKDKPDFQLNTQHVLGTTSLVTGQWYHIAGTYDRTLPSANIRLYVNGVQEPNPVNYTLPISYYYNQYFIGGGEIAYYMFNGTIDEVRRSATARSADWLLAEYETQTGTLSSFGAEESQ